MKKIAPPLPDPFIVPVCHDEIQILHKDASILVINKPSGLLSLSGKNPLNKDSVHYRLVQDYPTATMVHRLDFGTSGLMLLALNKEANGHLTKQLQARTITKTYEAVLLGHIADEKGVIDLPLAKGTFPYQKVCHESGKSAQSHFHVIERLQDSVSGTRTTRVLFSPLTGRTHQLRLHSQEIGHPIIGCDLYGLTIEGVDSHSLANRLMLHANSLEFEHPDSGQRMEFKCAMDFKTEF